MILSILTSSLSAVFIFTCVFGAALIACICETLSFLLIRPISLAKHRQVCLRFTHAFFLVAPFLVEKWSSITIRSYGDSISPKNAHLTVINHNSDVDWLLGLAHVSHFGYPFPGNSKSVVKASVAGVPIFGRILKFAEFLFITRSWATDRDGFLSTLKSLRGYTQTVAPLWFVLYPEGTRLTPDKLERSKRYALSTGLVPHDHVLFPRFKAFISILSTLRDDFDGVLDATLIFEGELPSMKKTLAGTASAVMHMHQKFYPMKDIPEEEAELEAWLLKRWYEKDQRLAEFKRDPSTLGPVHDSYFPMDREQSLLPFYSLVITFLLSFIIVTYVFSRIPNGVSILITSAILLVGLSALVMLINIKPSKKGSTKGQSRSKRYSVTPET